MLSIVLFILFEATRKCEENIKKLKQNEIKLNVNERKNKEKTTIDSLKNLLIW